jgi:ankyrin repeat protein
MEAAFRGHAAFVTQLLSRAANVNAESHAVRDIAKNGDIR